MQPANLTAHRLRAGMIGAGMIFDETYRPVFEQLHADGLYRREFGFVEVPLAATASRTGDRAKAYKASAGGRIGDFANFSGESAVDRLIATGVDFVCVATPDDRHFDAACRVLRAGKHLLIEKPSVLRLQELDALNDLARQHGVLARVVYHKLFDPDHKKLRTLVRDGELKHVNNGYCSLLEPKQISGRQFAEWITGRNPGTYVAVHYIKLIDFTFNPSPLPLSPQAGRGNSESPLAPLAGRGVGGDGWRLARISCTGQRGIVGPAGGNTWDSVQLRMVYEYDDRREAAFDIHTSWVTPDNFPGYVEQEVQFRFDNGVWNGHSRKRGVELTIEGKTPTKFKTTINTHYNGTFIEPWNARAQRGYGLEAVRHFIEEVAFVEFGGAAAERPGRLDAIRRLDFSDLAADRQTIATVQAMEAILERHTAGSPNCVVHVNHAAGGLVLFEPGRSEPIVLYQPKV